MAVCTDTAAHRWCCFCLFFMYFLVRYVVFGTHRQLLHQLFHTARNHGWVSLLSQQSKRDSETSRGPWIVVDADRRRRWRRERKQKRGCRSGLLARLRKDPHRPPLQNKCIFLSNTQSLANKMDELELLVTGGCYVRNCCIMVITKSWFHPLIPSEAIQLPSHTVHGSDRNKEESGKSRGGGLCIYVHGDWCSRIYKKKLVHQI